MAIDLVDWLAVFGISLDDVSRFQVFFPSLADSRVRHAGLSPGTLLFLGSMTSRKQVFRRRSLPSVSGSHLVRDAVSIRHLAGCEEVVPLPEDWISRRARVSRSASRERRESA